MLAVSGRASNPPHLGQVHQGAGWAYSPFVDMAVGDAKFLNGKIIPELFGGLWRGQGKANVRPQGRHA